MVIKGTRICRDTNCNKEPSHNFKGHNKSIYCAEHATAEMIRIKGIWCISPGCEIQASFNLPNKSPPIYCKEHSQENMININSKVCAFKECNQYAYYKGENSGWYCRRHSNQKIFYTKGRICEDNYCSRAAGYNYKGKNRRFCRIHASTGMVNVANKICQEKECQSTARFGYPGQALAYCKTHTSDKSGLMRFSMSKCSICGKLAIYGVKRPEHCEDHKHKQEYNLIENPCKSCKLNNVLSLKGLCSYCDPENRYNMKKEEKIKILLDNNKFKYIQHDKIIEEGLCGKERPDFLFDCGTHMLILEVDENQHKSYACECEQARMINITQALGMTTIFVRYNPDKFKDTIGKYCKITEKERHKILLRYLNSLTLFKFTKTKVSLNVFYLFYDNHDFVNFTKNFHKIDLDTGKVI